MTERKDCERCNGKGLIYPPPDELGVLCPDCDGTGVEEGE